MLAVTEHQACKDKVGRLIGISSIDPANVPLTDRALLPQTGRLWVDRCEAHRDNGLVRTSIAARGWTTIHTTREMDLGALFAVDGLTAFAFTADFAAPVRVAAAGSTLSVWLPDPTLPHFAFHLMRPPNVRPANIRGQVGRAWTKITSDYELKVVTGVADEGANKSRAAIAAGFTATVDLCTGQADSASGQLPAGARPRHPYPDDGSRWLANERVQLDGDAVDFAGPFDGRGGPIRLELQTERGAGIATRLVCADLARAHIDAWVQGRATSDAVRFALALIAQPAQSIQDVDGACPLVLVTAPLARDGAVYRFRVSAQRDRPEALVRCGRP